MVVPCITDIYKAVSLNALDHLRINLYSDIAGVLAEAVANAWDTGAESVAIKSEPEATWIRTLDNGSGMPVHDTNGKCRRGGCLMRDEAIEHGKTITKGRPVMRRKWLGKLKRESTGWEVAKT